jgi:hypothetical protein
LLPLHDCEFQTGVEDAGGDQILIKPKDTDAEFN